MDEHAANILAAILEGLRSAAPGLGQEDQRRSRYFDEASAVLQTPDGQKYRLLIAKMA